MRRGFRRHHKFVRSSPALSLARDTLDLVTGPDLVINLDLAFASRIIVLILDSRGIDRPLQREPKRSRVLILGADLAARSLRIGQ
ncbi:MAG: hypothetical protein AB8G23_00860 [Myxococcota bacterium]